MENFSAHAKGYKCCVYHKLKIKKIPVGIFKNSKRFLNHALYFKKADLKTKIPLNAQRDCIINLVIETIQQLAF
jgi:hypothetical protein